MAISDVQGSMHDVIDEAARLLCALEFSTARGGAAHGEHVHIIADPEWDEAAQVYRLSLLCYAPGVDNANWAGMPVILRRDERTAYVARLDKRGHATLCSLPAGEYRLAASSLWWESRAPIFLPESTRLHATGSVVEVLLTSRNQTSEILVTYHNLAQVLKVHQAAVALAERRAAEDPTNVHWQNDLRISSEKLTEIVRVLNNPTEALKTYRLDSALTERFTQQELGFGGSPRRHEATEASSTPGEPVVFGDERLTLTAQQDSTGALRLTAVAQDSRLAGTSVRFSLVDDVDRVRYSRDIALAGIGEENRWLGQWQGRPEIEQPCGIVCQVYPAA